MKERPILFSGEMVRAILNGQKTQTRRVCKLQPTRDIYGWWILTADEGKPFLVNGQACSVLKTTEVDDLRAALQSLPCPYGVPGDRLWVRECFGFTAQWPLSYQRQWLAERSPWLPGNITMAYRADEPEGNWCWKPSIHMPKIYSRITLEIVNVRVERVREITEDDAREEGIIIPDYMAGTVRLPHGGAPVLRTSYGSRFADLWDRINAERGYGWDTNPWVWVIEFKRVETKGGE